MLLSLKAHKALPAIFLACGLVAGQESSNSSFDVLDYVNPLIGTSNGGKSSPLRASTRQANITVQVTHLQGQLCPLVRSPNVPDCLHAL